jgi:uncharacterized protein YbjT (DUF2867 family)
VDEKKAILITGATGQQAGAVARELAARGGFTLRGLTRHPDGEAAKSLAALGVTPVAGELDDAESLRRACRGAWGVYSVQNTWTAGVEGEEEQGKRLATVAREAGVTHFVYSSVASAQRKTGIPHFENKWRIEEAVRAAGFPSWTILRPVWFMTNWLSPWNKPGIDEGKLAVGLPAGTRLQEIALEDIGKYGALAFERQEELNRRAIDIAGDEKTMTEVAEILSRAAGRKIVHVEVPIPEVRKFSEDFAVMLEWFVRVGYDVDIAGNARKYGIRPTPLEEWAKRQKW